MKKRIVIVLLAALAINDLWADWSVGAYEIQGLVHLNEPGYLPFGGIGFDCEYDFLDSNIRPVVGIETGFWGLGLELYLKAGGFADFYSSDNNILAAEVNYLIGPSLSFKTAIAQGCNCLFCFEHKLSEKKSFYLKTGLRYKYFNDSKAYYFVDIPLKFGFKFK